MTAKEWMARWPNHCQKCGGWGGSYYPDSPPSYSCGGESGGFDPCEPEDRCHRCGGELNVNPDTDEVTGPCSGCG
ncbi:MAG TPA: hypothetical protein VGD78_20945 [Chthoniobacterales bacterium]